MPSPIIVFLDSSTLDRGDIDFSPLRKLGQLTLHPTSTPDQIPHRVREAEIVLSNKAVLHSENLSQATHLRLVAVCATGTNNVDLEAARSRGIRVTNVAGYGTHSVAQHALAFILNWATHIPIYTRETQQWCQSKIFTRLDHPVRELHGKTLGLIGTGKIGSETGRLASAFGMNILAMSRKDSHPTPEGWKRLPLRDLLPLCDVISLHCPLTPETRHVINPETISWMKPGAFLVNTGRGDLVDETVLIDGLRSGKLSGAGLDVLSQEPPPPNHPLTLLNHPGLMITPHTAWTAVEARQRLMNEVTANVEAFIQGKERNIVV